MLADIAIEWPVLARLDGDVSDDARGLHVNDN